MSFDSGHPNRLNTRDSIYFAAILRSIKNRLRSFSTEIILILIKKVAAESLLAIGIALVLMHSDSKCKVLGSGVRTPSIKKIYLTKPTRHMKKVLLMSAMLVAGAAMAAPALLQKNVTPMDQTIQQEKVKIEAEALPEAIKKVIAENEELKALPIAEAFQIAQLDGKFQFEVIFDNGTEEKITKKYDLEGNEIKG